MTVVPELLTAEDFWRLPENGMQRVLVDGEVIETMPPGGLHGVIAGELHTLLRMWAKRGPGGRSGVESGFILRHDPDTVRGPDVFYVRADRVPASGVPEAFWDLAPDLAVEVVSPGETADEVQEKIHDYLAAGVGAVWVIYPRTKQVVVHTPDKLAHTYGGDDVLEQPELLPGFTCTVSELFG